MTEGLDPIHVALTTKPGQLPLGKISSGLLNLGDRFVQTGPAAQMLGDLAVPDKGERFGLQRDATSKKPANFLDPARSEHLGNAAVNFRVELLPLRPQADFDYAKALQRRTARGMHGGDRLVR